MEFTREQRQAIETGAEKALVVAGPGSGKTTVLTERLCTFFGKWVSGREDRDFPPSMPFAFLSFEKTWAIKKKIL